MDPTLEERRLVKNILAGDQKALDYFFQTFIKRLYSFILRRMKDDEHDAQDVLQETSISAFNTLATWNGKSNLYTWLCGIAKHKIYDFLKRKHRDTNELPETAKQKMVTENVSITKSMEEEKEIIGFEMSVKFRNNFRAMKS